VRVFVAGGVAALVLGLLWSRVLPLSKPLWTGSFVLVTAGLTMLALALVGFVVDVRGLRRWCRPFVWLGANALAIYVSSEIVRRLLEARKSWLFWNVLEPAFRPWPAEIASLAFAVGVLVMWMVLAGVLYRFKGRGPAKAGPCVTESG
jgi:predicted acyltransferase